MNAYAKMVALALLVVACGITKPTYIDISPEKQAEIAARIGVDVETALTERMAVFREALSKDLGVVVTEIRKRENGTVTAVVEPVTETITNETVETVGKDPTNFGKWAQAAVAAAMLAATWVFGMRGRKDTNGDVVPETPKTSKTSKASRTSKMSKTSEVSDEKE